MQPATLATYELKYCERCGSLRLRRTASEGTYCEPCGQMLANFSLHNHVERATLLLRKSRAASRVPVEVDPAGLALLPCGRVQ